MDHRMTVSVLRIVSYNQNAIDIQILVFFQCYSFQAD
jgi:hypothetical protein